MLVELLNPAARMSAKSPHVQKKVLEFQMWCKAEPLCSLQQLLDRKGLEAITRNVFLRDFVRLLDLTEIVEDLLVMFEGLEFLCPLIIRFPDDLFKGVWPASRWVDDAAMLLSM